MVNTLGALPEHLLEECHDFAKCCASSDEFKKAFYWRGCPLFILFGLICPLFCPFKASDRWLNPANVSAFWQPNQSVNRPHKWHWTRFTSLDVVKWTFVFSIMPNMIIINIIFRLRLEFRDFAKFWCHTEQKYQRQWPRY